MRPTVKKVAFTHSEARISQNLIAVVRQRPVVERQHHFVILERQRLGVLHGADAGMLQGIDHQRRARCPAHLDGRDNRRPKPPAGRCR